LAFDEYQSQVAAMHARFERMQPGGSKMQRNVGTVDLVVRSMTGIGIIAYLAKDGVFAQGSAPGLLIAIYLVATAILMYCPLYRLLGFSSYGPLDRVV
jgi:hypothetical protein